MLTRLVVHLLGDIFQDWFYTRLAVIPFSMFGAEALCALLLAAFSLLAPGAADLTFMLALIWYALFCLVMAFDFERKRRKRVTGSVWTPPAFVRGVAYISIGGIGLGGMWFASQALKDGEILIGLICVLAVGGSGWSCAQIYRTGWFDLNAKGSA